MGRWGRHAGIDKLSPAGSQPKASTYGVVSWGNDVTPAQAGIQNVSVALPSPS